MADATVTEIRKAAHKGDIKLLKNLKAEGADMNQGNYDKRTPLHIAASAGAVKTVECLVEDCECNLNREDRFGGTPLDDALRNNHKDVADYLIKKGAFVGKTCFPGDDSGILCDAASKADLSLLRVLVKRGVDINLGDYDRRTAIHLASSEGKLKVVKCLVEELKADPNVKDRWNGTPLDDALRTGQKSVYAFLKKNKGKSGKVATVTSEDATAMCDSASSGDSERLVELAGKGLDINMADYDDRTAIHLASSEGLLLVITCLVEELNCNLNVSDRYGGTPLDDAIRHGHAGVADYLKEKGALRGKTALYQDSISLLVAAGGKGDLDSLKNLIKKSGVDPNACNADQRTALHMAASEGILPAVKLLVNDLGADINAVDRWGGTALDDAYYGQHEEVIQFLESKGGVKHDVRDKAPEGNPGDYINDGSTPVAAAPKATEGNDPAPASTKDAEGGSESKATEEKKDNHTEITCEKCEAVYRVAIPDLKNGRQVQCSSCQHKWFQKAPGK